LYDWSLIIFTCFAQTICLCVKFHKSGSKSSSTETVPWSVQVQEVCSG
jgi:hypothetical protein